MNNDLAGASPVDQPVRPLSEARHECDCCGEVWEASFFCEKCTNTGELAEVRTPDPMWELAPIGDDWITEERYVYRSVCGNCCGCR